MAIPIKADNTSPAALGVLVDNMLDIFEPVGVQVQIGKDGRLWVNVNGICALRCTAPTGKPVEVIDERK